ncbi:MAG TPA: hypothetical protein VIY08_06225 [Candidatus Nitrosocosmicus sp.]
MKKGDYWENSVRVEEHIELIFEVKKNESVYKNNEIDTNVNGTIDSLSHNWIPTDQLYL